MATFEVRAVFAEHRSKWGVTRKQHGLSEVWFNGARCGYCPSNESDSCFRILHPVSGFPEDLVPAVVKASNGRLTGSLKSPEIIQEDDDEYDDMEPDQE